MTKIEIAAGVLAPFAAIGLRWAAVAYCEKKAAEAETDGVEDWEDVFWPRMLRRLSQKQFEHVRRQVAEKDKVP